MSLKFIVGSDVERDSMYLEVHRLDTDLWLYVEETADGEYVVESQSPPEGTTFTAQETALIVAHALRFAGLRVLKPDGRP